jgi:hypothetical protein
VSFVNIVNFVNVVQLASLTSALPRHLQSYHQETKIVEVGYNLVDALKRFQADSRGRDWH